MRRIRAFIALCLLSPMLAFGQSGVYRFPGQIQGADGTVSLPQYSWSSDPDTGLYRIGANQIGFATNGVLRAQADATGFTVPAGQLFSASGGGTLTGTFAGAVTWSGLATFNAGATVAAGQILAVGSPTTNSTDPAININRTLTGAGNSHAFSDSSTFSKDAATAYASYDARVTISGANNLDHYVSMQAAPTFSSYTGTMTNLYGVYSTANIGAGSTITNYSAYRVSDPTGAGTLTNNYGLYIEAQTKGTNKYAIYSLSEAPIDFNSFTAEFGNNNTNGNESLIRLRGRTSGGTAQYAQWEYKNTGHVQLTSGAVTGILKANVTNSSLQLGAPISSSASVHDMYGKSGAGADPLLYLKTNDYSSGDIAVGIGGLKSNYAHITTYQSGATGVKAPFKFFTGAVEVSGYDVAGDWTNQYYTKLGEAVDGGGTTPAFAVKKFTGTTDTSGFASTAHGLGSTCARIKAIYGTIVSSGTDVIALPYNSKASANGWVVPGCASTDVTIAWGSDQNSKAYTLYVMYEAS